VTVIEELTRLALVMTLSLEREPIDRPPERERLLPWPAVKRRFWREVEAVVEVAVSTPTVNLPTELEAKMESTILA
jgi:hypothetical protein